MKPTKKEIESQLKEILAEHDHTVSKKNLSLFVQKLIKRIDQCCKVDKEDKESAREWKLALSAQRDELKEFEKFKTFFKSCKNDLIMRGGFFNVTASLGYRDEKHKKIDAFSDDSETDRSAEENLLRALDKSLSDVVSTMKRGLKGNKSGAGRPSKVQRTILLQGVIVMMECLLGINAQRTMNDSLPTNIYAFAIALMENRISPQGKVLWQGDRPNYHQILSLFYDDPINVACMKNIYLQFDRPDLFFKHIKRTKYEKEVLAMPFVKNDKRLKINNNFG